MTTTTTTRASATSVPASAPVRARGVLDLAPNGAGLLRPPDLLPTSRDVQVPAALVRRLGLRHGDVVDGTSRRPGAALTTVETVDGLPADAARHRPRFADLTPLYPVQRLRMESPGSGLAGRVIDLFAPVGKGQRGLIAAPPRTGKTVILQQLAAAVAANHPEVHLMVLLVDERPEEVTDMQRSVRGEVFASTFDRPPKAHLALAELAVARAQRLVERGRDVVLLLDSLTRLCRAYNNAAAAGGRTLSGGVDASALQGPKRLFGAARNTEEAGSLTILASVLVETGSRADDYFFEELKSTGNLELRLDRALAQHRVHPAVDLEPTGTRREELLLGAEELATVRALRRALGRRDDRSSYETLLGSLRQTPDNATFLRQVRSAG